MTDLHVSGCPEQVFTIFIKCLSQILRPHYNKNQWTELYEILYLVASQHKLILIRFWCASVKRFCCLKFSISLIQWHSAKLCAIALITDNLRPNTLKFKIFIYNNSSKIKLLECFCAPVHRLFFVIFITSFKCHLLLIKNVNSQFEASAVIF